MIRFPTREVKVGSRPLGGLNPIRLQSMTNTDTRDVRNTVAQTIKIFEAGADYVRISVPDKESAGNLTAIRSALHRAGFVLPLVADIHYRPELALDAARVFEAVRINPGNYTGATRKGKLSWTDKEYHQAVDEIRKNVAPLLAVCREYGCAVRVGTNFGSLSQRVVWRFGSTPEAMVEATMEFLRSFEELGFYNTVVSLKASNPLIMIRSYLLMVERMLQEGMAYPLHVGVTEAGEGEDGRIKSALGISTLLQAGIGDTIRVSLSEAPEAEIPVAHKIAQPFQALFTKAPNNGEKFLLKSFDWTTETPILPGGVKAIVLHHKVESNPDLVVPVDLRELSEAKTGMQVKTQPGKLKGEFPVFVMDEIATNNAGIHPEFNFIVIQQKPANSFYERLKNIPNPILLCLTQNKENLLLPDLFEQKELHNIEAAIIDCRIFDETDEDHFLVRLVERLGPDLLKRKIQGIWAITPNIDNPARINQISFGLLQAAGLRITKSEFISCPTCSRTSFDLVSVVKQVKELAGHLPGIKIAIMGCVVNGPGEMADADFGILGATQGKVHIYQGNKPILRNIEQGIAAKELVKLIEQNLEAGGRKNILP
ncbi:MAG TPA: (E)-4-hydroxy-3-methylbut-2-enyl-diphosphate synthase [Bacteroidales bacterium]|nr:(E)-4-hydroxy-3-methylbut-2-enyl-diphosphate synthase [Bacteroidales bacterium]